MAEIPGAAVSGSDPEQAVRSTEASIFRESAIRHYRQSQERIEFPRLTTPRVLSILWFLVIAFIVLGVFALSSLLFPIG